MNTFGLARARNFLVLVLLFALSACSNSSNVNGDGTLVDTVTVTPANATLAAGESLNFSAVATLRDGTTQDVTAEAEWVSQNNSIASVSNISGSKGQALGRNAGTTNILAVFGGVTGGTALSVTEAVIESIQIDPPSATVAQGTDRQFQATAIFSDASTSNVTTTATWATGNAGIATVNATGLLTAAAVGQTVVTASVGGTTGSASVTVSDATLQSISIEPKNDTLAANRTLPFTAMGTFSDGSQQDLTNSCTWSSSNESIVTIDGTGLASGVAEGAAQITATSQGVSDTTGLTVTAPVALDRLEVTPVDGQLANGTDLQFTATAVFADATTDDVTTEAVWSSDDEAVLLVSNDAGSEGLASGVSVGTANLTATFGGASDVVPVTVTDAILISLDVTPATQTLTKGSLQQFTATGTLSDNSTQDFTTAVVWSSSNSTVTSISNASGNEGLAGANEIGSAVITATSGDISDQATVTVTDAVLQSLTLTLPQAKLADGFKMQATASGDFSDGSTRDVTSSVAWSLTGATTTTITANGGLISAPLNSAETVGVEARLGGKVAAQQLQVVDVVLNSLTISPASLPDLPVGFTEALSATAVFSDAAAGPDTVTTQVTWNSDATGTATVSNASGTQGVVTGRAPGSANITISHPAVVGGTTNDPAPVTVIAATTVQSIAVTPSSASAAKGVDQQFRAIATLANGTTRDVTTDAALTWIVGNPVPDPDGADSAEVSNLTGEKGVARGISFDDTTPSVANQNVSNISVTFPGVANITPARFTVTEPVPVALSITPSAPNDGFSTVFVGFEKPFETELVYSDGARIGDGDEHPDFDTTSRDVEAVWSSLNANILTVNANGLAEGVSAGTTSLVVRFNEASDDSELKSGSTGISVVAAELVGLTISTAGDDRTLVQGQLPPDTIQFFALGNFSTGQTGVDITNQVTWNTSSPNSVAISNQGVATSGIQPGNSSITATRDGVSSNAIVITNAPPF